ncbi:unnamed protein product [Boreogadus saida]
MSLLALAATASRCHAGYLNSAEMSSSGRQREHRHGRGGRLPETDTCERPLEDGLEEEEEECVSEENELMAKDEFSTEENFSAEFETENMSCEDMEYFSNKGEGDANREAGDEMDTQSEKTRHPPAGPEDWDGPSELDSYPKDGERRVHTRQQLPVGTTWGPFEGKIEMNLEGGGMTRWPCNQQRSRMERRPPHVWCTAVSAVPQGRVLMQLHLARQQCCGLPAAGGPVVRWSGGPVGPKSDGRNSIELFKARA